jgi:hypothetical protein
VNFHLDPAVAHAQVAEQIERGDYHRLRAWLAGTALLGIGVGSGRSRATEAAQAAMTSPLLESARIDGARGCVINISGGRDMTLEDMTTASEVIYDVVDPEANIIVGAVVDESLEGEIHVTVIATGFQGGNTYRPERTISTFSSDLRAAHSQAQGHRGIEMAARNGADGEGHGQDCEAKGQADAVQPDARGTAPRLYHLEEDIGEKTNVAGKHPEIVTKLQALAAKMSTEIAGPKATARRPAGAVAEPRTLYPTGGGKQSGEETPTKPAAPVP